MQIGDEISHINGYSVVNASHRDVISLMGEAAAQGEVVLGMCRKQPVHESVPRPVFQDYQPALETPFLPQGRRDVTIERPSVGTSFGFVLQSFTLRAGCMICEFIVL